MCCDRHSFVSFFFLCDDLARSPQPILQIVKIPLKDCKAETYSCQKMDTVWIHYFQKMLNDWKFTPSSCHHIGYDRVVFEQWKKSVKMVWQHSPIPSCVMFDMLGCPMDDLGDNNSDRCDLDAEDHIMSYTLGDSNYKTVYIPHANVKRRCRKYDDLVTEHSLYPPDILRVHHIGCEKEVLVGARQTLKHTQFLFVDVPSECLVQWIECLPYGNWKLIDYLWDQEHTCFVNLETINPRNQMLHFLQGI